MLSPLVAPKPLRIPSPRTEIRQDEEDLMFRAPDDHLAKSCGREAVEDPSEEVQRILDEEKSPRNMVSPKAKQTPLSTPRAKRTPISTPKASGQYEESVTFRARGPSFLFTASSPKAVPIATTSPKAIPAATVSPKASTTSITTPRATSKDEQKTLSSPRLDPTQRSPPINIITTPRATPRSSHAPTPTAAAGPPSFKREKPPRSREISPMTMLPPTTHDPEQEFASEDELDNMTPPARCNNPTPAAWDMRSSTPIEISLRFSPVIRTGEHAYSY